MEAIPLCIPNNCSWDETLGVFQRDWSQPCTGLQPVHSALRKLRSIGGPVCVVSIAGACRKGKSYILSEVFDQGNVFPLGHSFDSQTMGIWLWVVPEKYKDTEGREFTVVLLDSEGTDAVSAERVNDHAVFTLSVLLSSVLIYNSVGIPTRTDLEGLDCISKISQRIQVILGEPLDEEASHEVFPSFVWLLRDVVLSLPEGVENLKAFFLERVFKVPGRPSGKSQEVVDNIMKVFPDFEAFPLPPPSLDATVLGNLNEKGMQERLSSSFKTGLKEFKQLLHSKLTPKRSFVGQGFVTGEALAKLVVECVRAANSPGAFPVLKSSQTEFRPRGQDSGSDFKESQARKKRANPLCLPNSYKWDPSSGHYIQTDERRTSLYVVEEELEKLRRIQGPICVVSIAGPRGKGKSFVLSEAFNQPQVFPLGHHMEPETIGIWSWIVKEKFKDGKGQEFTVVLLDSEGMDAVTGEDLGDRQIFTLTLLLASVFIYNSEGVPTQNNLQRLEYPLKYFE